LRILIDERVKRVLFWLWCLAWFAMLVVSLRPLQEMPFGISDKLYHFAAYAVMSAAVAGFCHDGRQVLRWTTFSVAMGGLVELGQHFVPLRSMELGDFLANTSGAGVGGAIALLWLSLVIAPLRRAAVAA
jgi:VanZ family protein